MGTQKREKVFDPRAAKLLRHKRKAVFLGTQKRRGIWSETPKVLRPKKKSGSFGHPKEKRYFTAPKREAVFDPRAPKLLRPEKKSGDACIEHAFAQIYCKKTYVSCHDRPMEKSRKKCCNLLWIRVCTSVLPGVYEHVIRGACTGRSHQLVFTVNYNTFCNFTAINHMFRAMSGPWKKVARTHGKTAWFWKGARIACKNTYDLTRLKTCTAQQKYINFWKCTSFGLKKRTTQHNEATFWGQGAPRTSESTLFIEK